MKFNAFAYCIHSNSDTSTELKWFTCSNVSIIIFTEKDSIYKRIDVNKKPDSLKIFVTSVKQHFIDKDNIAWVYLNCSSKKLGDVLIKFGLFNKETNLNGEKQVGYLLINTSEGAVGYALKL